MPEPAPDALQALRDRLEETRLHAERLAQEAADVRRQAQTRREAGDDAREPAGPPPPGGDEPGPGAPPSDLQAIAVLLETLRELVPPELQQQLADVTRQVLLLVRALIDWWVDRLAEPAAPASGAADATAGPDPARVRNIPVR